MTEYQENFLRRILEESVGKEKLSMSDIDEIVGNIKSMKGLVSGIDVPTNNQDMRQSLKNMLDNETDWKKKAAIAARIVALDID